MNSIALMAFMVSGSPQCVVVEMPVTGYYRKSMYDVWQYYGVDRSGNFSPRYDLNSGGDPFNMYNGRPFYNLPTKPSTLSPHVIR